MIVIYSKPARRTSFEVASMRLSYLSQMRIAEYAATFAADSYTSVWLVPSVSEA